MKMESKLFLFPGQTLSNTNISDRARALYISSKSWQNITSHLDRKRLLKEAAIKEKAYKKELKAKSEAMTKQWDNSIENIRKRKEEERLQRITKKEEDKIKRFYELKKEQEATKKAYVEKVRKKIYTNKGYARDVNAALLFSEVLYERENQINFVKFLQKHKQEEDNLEAEQVKAEVIKFNKENEEKAKKIAEEQQEFCNILKNQIEEIAKAKETEQKQRIEKESRDNIRAAKEMKKIEKIQMEDKQKKKREMFLEKKKLFEEAKKRKELLIQEDRDIDAIINIHAQAKYRIDALRKAKEKELQDAIIARREAASKQAVADAKIKEEAEEKCLRNAIAEKEASDLAKIEEKIKLKALLREERIADRKQFLERRAEEERLDAELKRWELLNRYKSDDVIKQYEKDKNIKKWNNTVEYRKELIKQMNDLEEINKLNKVKENELFQQQKDSIQKEDEQFFEYATEVLDLVKSKGRSTYPVEKVIEKYKTDNDLIVPNQRTKYQNCKHYKEK